MTATDHPEAGQLIVRRFPLGNQWPTVDPFLFVAHHRDAYPSGDDRLAPDAPLTGRQIGMDFDDVDGWNMYHGSVVPGFPQHPHRGFETITHVRSGFIDHSDSMGATARFGRGDTQWMTAGAGVVHAEMFPLLDQSGPNPLELFQIWLNLPAADKMVDPYFTMLWREQTPGVVRSGPDGSIEVTVVAGALQVDGTELSPLDPPPDSWASRAEADVAVWYLRLTGDGAIELPPSAVTGTRRSLYPFAGSTLLVGGEPVAASTGVEVRADVTVPLAADGGEIECIVLQGRPIGEPVAQYGPFVMNDKAGIATAIDDFQRTAFGGWPWPSDDPVHERGRGRFARHADGRVEDRSL